MFIWYNAVYSSNYYVIICTQLNCLLNSSKCLQQTTAIPAAITFNLFWYKKFWDILWISKTSPLLKSGRTINVTDILITTINAAHSWTLSKIYKMSRAYWHIQNTVTNKNKIKIENNFIQIEFKSILKSSL